MRMAKSITGWSKRQENKTLRPIKLLFLAGELDAAAEASLDYLRTCCDSSEGNRLYAHILRDQGKLIEALKVVRFVVRMCKVIPSDFELMGQVCMALERPEGALMAADDGLERYPRNRELLILKAASLKSLDRFVEAAGILNQLVKRDPNDFEAWLELGKVYTDARDTKAALSCFENALELEPRNADLWYNRGVALCNAKGYSEAILCMETFAGFAEPDHTEQAVEILRFARSMMNKSTD